MGYILVHIWPVVAKTNAVEGMIEVEVAADWVGMECNENNVPEFRGDDLQFDMVTDEIDVLVDVEHVFMELDHATSQWLTVNVMYFFQVFFDDQGRVG